MNKETCIVDTDYEIFSEFPHQIRRKSNKRIVKEFIGGNGYASCKLNSKAYHKHRIVALQFIPNPDNLPCVDHKNRNRSDYHIENLRFVSYTENNKNKSSNLNVELEYFDEIPAEENDIIQVREYGNHEFEDLYYANDCFYVWNGIQYRKLTIIYDNRTEAATVKAWNKNKKRVVIYYSKFKRLYNLV